MTRIFGLNVLPEMLALWLLETSICFLAFYLLLHGSAFAPPHDSLAALPMAAAPSLANPGSLANPLSLAGTGLAGTGLAGAGLAGAGLMAPPGVDALLLALTVGLVGFAIGLYRPETCLETRRLLLKAGVAAAISLPAVWMVARVGGIDLAGLFGAAPVWPLELLLAWGGLLLATRLLYTTALRMDWFVRRVAVLGPPLEAERTIEAIAGLRRFLFRVEAIQPPAPEPMAPEPIAPEPMAPEPIAHGLLASRRADLSPGVLPKGLWGVVFAGPVAPGTLPLGTLPPGVRGFNAKTFWEDQLGRIDVASAAVFAPPIQGALAAAAAANVRRGFDIVFASLLLLLTAPVLLVTALLIRLESSGPVIYRQERVGLGGRSFTIWKFRSMRQDAERAGPIWASPRDSRVTAVGGLIRKVRIDELPQLVNILRGEMSLVGPRPERPHFVAQLAEQIPLYHERARVKPGLTGWAQVNYPYGASVEDARAKLSYDLYYVKRRSLLFDFLILLATVRVILFQEGAR